MNNTLIRAAIVLVVTVSLVSAADFINCTGLGVFTKHQGTVFKWKLPNCPEDLGLRYAVFPRGRDSPTFMTLNNIPSSMKPDQKTIFLIHGYTGAHHSWQDEDFNIVQVYWDSDRSYSQSSSDTQSVGAAVGEMARHLANRHKFTGFWCIGHSLGAHTCGMAGKRYKNGFQRITALDPAGPAFKTNHDMGVERSSGQYVDVIHTNGQTYGYMQVVGHTDFYVNGGKNQPRCDGKTPSCDHSFAHQIFSASINTGHGCKTSLGCTYEYSELNCKPENKQQSLGFNSDKFAGRGLFLVKTSNSSPYC